MDAVFLYWDHSGLVSGAERLADAFSDGPNARSRVRLHLANMVRLAEAGRPLAAACGAGPAPPEMRPLWNRLENAGAEVALFDGLMTPRLRYESPVRSLQIRMLETALDLGGDPGVAVVLTGESAGWTAQREPTRTLERMRRRGWRVELVSWARAGDDRLRTWAEENGVFVPLDDFYSSVTFTVPSRPGQELARPRHAAALDLSRRPRA